MNLKRPIVILVRGFDASLPSTPRAALRALKSAGLDVVANNALGSLCLSVALHGRPTANDLRQGFAGIRAVHTGKMINRTKRPPAITASQEGLRPVSFPAPIRTEFSTGSSFKVCPAYDALTHLHTVARTAAGRQSVRADPIELLDRQFSPASLARLCNRAGADQPKNLRT
jgi:hypothetical protein